MKRCRCRRGGTCGQRAKCPTHPLKDAFSHRLWTSNADIFAPMRNARKYRPARPACPRPANPPPPASLLSSNPFSNSPLTAPGPLCLGRFPGGAGGAVVVRTSVNAWGSVADSLAFYSKFRFSLEKFFFSVLGGWVGGLAWVWVRQISPPPPPPPMVKQNPFSFGLVGWWGCLVAAASLLRHSLHAPRPSAHLCFCVLRFLPLLRCSWGRAPQQTTAWLRPRGCAMVKCSSICFW